jgi:hypothetical protein
MLFRRDGVVADLQNGLDVGVREMKSVKSVSTRLSLLYIFGKVIKWTPVFVFLINIKRDTNP